MECAKWCEQQNGDGPQVRLVCEGISAPEKKRSRREKRQQRRSPPAFGQLCRGPRLQDEVARRSQRCRRPDYQHRRIRRSGHSAPHCCRRIARNTADYRRRSMPKAERRSAAPGDQRPMAYSSAATSTRGDIDQLETFLPRCIGETLIEGNDLQRGRPGVPSPLFGALELDGYGVLAEMRPDVALRDIPVVMESRPSRRSPAWCAASSSAPATISPSRLIRCC
jgi:hypothetical protein